MSRSSVVFVVVIILQVAGAILAQDDTAGDVKPCTDFFTYSCKLRNSTNSPRWMLIETILDNYLFKAKQQSDLEKNIYKFRQQCTQPSVKDQKNFIRSFNPSVDGWPAVNKNWKADKFDLQAALAELHSFNFPAVFKIALQNEKTEPFRNQISIEPSVEHHRFSEDYESVIRRQLSNVIDNVDEVINDSRTVVGLFVTGGNPPHEHILMDYKGLKREIPEIDWDKHFEIMYGQKVPDSFAVKVNKLGLLKRIIRKIVEVDPKVMANYLFYRLVFYFPHIDDITPSLLEDVAYDMLRYHYTNETKQELRGMLIAFLKTLHNTANLFGDEDKSSIEKAIREFVMDEIIPDIDNSYFKNTYGELTVSEGDCYSTITKLIHTYWKLQSQIYFKREVDPLYSMRFALKKTLMRQLPLFLDKSSAILFDVLIWDSLSEYFGSYWDMDKFKLFQQCLEKQLDEKLDKVEMGEVLKIKIFTKAYFDWAKDNNNLLQLEETKYNESSKKVLLERLITRCCTYDLDLYYLLRKSTVSGVFANMKEVSEVYDCPVGSRFNPQSRCEFELV